MEAVVIAAGLRIGEMLRSIAEWLMSFGPFGLFGIALLDSALVPLPSGPDVIMIGLSAARPHMMPVYALVATAGSTVGCTLLYLLARRAGAAALARVAEQRRRRIEGLLGRYDMLAVMVPAVLPPPFPFKAFVICAGAFKLKLVRFIVAIFLGRAARFLLEGWLAIQFGGDAIRLIKEHGPAVLIGVLVAIVLLFILSRLRSRSRGVPSASAEAAGNSESGLDSGD